MAFKSKNTGPDKALRKAKHYCSYQERNHMEVKAKLYSYGLSKSEVEELLSRLIEENYLNEQRYALAFAGGKFRMKQWGKTKIRYELQQKKVSSYCIKKGLSSIEEEVYETTLQNLAETKLKTLKGEDNLFIKKKKLQNYLIGKGYEFDLIGAAINKLLPG